MRPAAREIGSLCRSAGLLKAHPYAPNLKTLRRDEKISCSVRRHEVTRAVPADSFVGQNAQHSGAAVLQYFDGSRFAHRAGDHDIGLGPVVVRVEVGEIVIAVAVEISASN